MKTKIILDIYRMAIDKWGDREQLAQAQEEATELSLAIRKYIRKPNEETLKHLAEEIADVEIMIEQIKMMNEHLDFQKMVDEQKEFKINRLIKRMNYGD